jgi:hypothetical protein
MVCWKWWRWGTVLLVALAAGSCTAVTPVPPTSTPTAPAPTSTPTPTSTPVPTLTPIPDDWPAEELLDAGMLIHRPPDWHLDRLHGVYGLAPPDVVLDYPPYIIVFNSIVDIPASDLEGVMEALAARYEEAGESGFTFQPAIVDGTDAVQVTGLHDTCLLLAIPRDGIVRTITVTPDACSEDGTPDDPAVRAILESVRLIEPVRLFEFAAPED